MIFTTITTILVWVVLNALTLTNAAALPSYIKVCNRNDPNINTCVKNTVHDMRPYLKDGIPEIMAPPMEPLLIGTLNILEGGPNGLNVKVKDLKINGASDFEITSISSSRNVKRFDFNLKLPHLQGFGDYEIHGKLLTLPLSGKGPFTGNFTDFTAAVTVIFNVVPINGVEKVSINHLGVEIGPGRGRVRLDNLFNGEKALGDTINQIINDNFQDFLNELIGPIQRALELKFREVASKIVENFTYDDLFPLQ